MDMDSSQHEQPEEKEPAFAFLVLFFFDMLILRQDIYIYLTMLQINWNFCSEFLLLCFVKSIFFKS